MNIDYEKNLKDALLKLQESLNGTIVNDYQAGVQYGSTLDLKESVNELGKPGGENIVKFTDELDLPKLYALHEAEKILRGYL